MLIVHRLSPGGFRYYLGAVGPGDPGGSAEPELGEVPGQWMGRAAAHLELSGRVAAADLRRILPRRPGRVPGFDLTFAAPKSVSVLHGLGDPATMGAVRAAHDAAVVAGVAYLERHACVVRVAGRAVDGHGFVVAAFRHRVSRADDPHLHTHAIVANVAPATTGEWRALLTPLLYAEQRGAGAVYQSVLRHELTAALRVTWTEPIAGRSDVVEVPPEIRTAFSRRRAAVLAEASVGVTAEGLVERGWAARVTRPERDDLVDMVALRASWVARAAGWSPALDARPRELRDAPPPAALDINELVPSDDRWTRSQLMVAIGGRLPAGAPHQVLEAVAEEAVNASGVIRLGLTGGRQAAERFTTFDAAARQVRVAAGLGGRVVSDAPDDLDRLRRQRAPDRVLIVARDDAHAAALADRSGALAVSAGDAARAIDALGLRAGDLMVITRPERQDSRALDAALAWAGARRVLALAARPPRATGAVERAPGLVVTADATRGSVSVAATAGAAVDVAVAEWAARRRDGRPAVLVAEPAEHAGLNAVARAELRAAGLVGDGGVGGWAVGDVVMFPHGRPSLGFGRYDIATVDDVSATTGSIAVLAPDGSRLSLSAEQLEGARPAHAVAPLPQLIAGRGDVFVVGGRRFAARHLGDNEIHHYLTADVGNVPAGASGLPRRASLRSIERWLAETAPALDPDRHRSLQALRQLHLEAVVRSGERDLPIPPSRLLLEAERETARGAIERDNRRGRERSTERDSGMWIGR